MIFNCKQLAKKELTRIEKINFSNLSLGVIQIGEDPVSEIYIGEKRKAAEKIGIDFNHYKFSSEIDFNDLKVEISELPDDGLIVQLPIKANLKTQEVLNLVPFEKDIDGLNEISVGKLITGRLDILPPVVGAVDKILSEKNISLKGKNLVSVGAGRLVGRPMVSYGLSKGSTVSIIRSSTKNPKKITKNADVIVTGVGKPEFIDETYIKKGVVVIDAGTSKVDDRVVGDVDIDSVKNKAALATPVPSGVGPLTVVSLLENLIKRNDGN